MARTPIVGEVVRVDFRFTAGPGGPGVNASGVTFEYLAPGQTVGAFVEAVQSLTNPETGATEDGWWFADVPTTVEGTYRCLAVATAPQVSKIPGSFVVAPEPF